MTGFQYFLRLRARQQRWTMKRTLWTASLLVAALTAVACGADFSPQSFIDKPRILGIRADPPDVQFSDAQQGTVVLTAFLALPTLPKDAPLGPREVKSLDWTLCVLNLGSAASYACALPEIPVDGDLATGTATFDGAVLYAQLEIIRPLMPKFVEFLKQTVTQSDACQNAVITQWDACAAQNGGDVATCVDPGFEAEKACILAAGQDITFRLTATWTDGTTDLVADAYKKVRFRTITAENPANRNPGFTLSVEKSRVAGTAPSPVGAVLACPGQTIDLEPVLLPGARETYIDAKGASQEEFVFLSWYTAVGDLDRLKSSTATVIPGDPIDLTNELVLPAAADMPDSFQAWVFVRDDRLGLDGLTYEVRRRADAECVAPASFQGKFTPPAVEVVPITPVSAADRSPTDGGAA